VLRLPLKGLGRALREAWIASQADILSYMDADLSSDLKAFPELVAKLSSGACDLATGSRLLRPELTTRSFKRELISRCYNRLIRLMFPNITFSDAQCGFKAITREAAQALLPQVEDTNWFFDTELLILSPLDAPAQNPSTAPAAHLPASNQIKLDQAPETFAASLSGLGINHQANSR
jgi:hypothetical protein